MKRIDDTSVDLDPREMIAYWHFQHRLDRGDSIDQAIDVVRYPTMSPEFEAWLR
jgi:hypothetical protein